MSRLSTVETLSRLLTSCTLGSNTKLNGCPQLIVIPLKKVAGRSLRKIWAAPIRFALVWALLLDSFELSCQITLTILLWSGIICAGPLRGNRRVGRSAKFRITFLWKFINPFKEITVLSLSASPEYATFVLRLFSDSPLHGRLAAEAVNLRR